MIEEELSEKVLGACFEVSNTLGVGFLESVYHKALLVEMDTINIKFNSQPKMEVKYKRVIVGDFIPDIIVEDKIILELKVAQSISNEMISQLMNYLKAGGIKLGYVINFGKSKLEWKRIVM